MTKGDIVQMPSGQPAKHRGVPDSFCIDSVRLLAKLQPEVSRV